MTNEQKKKLWHAIDNNDLETLLKILSACQEQEEPDLSDISHSGMDQYGSLE